MDETRGLLDLIIRRLPGVSLAKKIQLCGIFTRETDLTTLTPRDIDNILGTSYKSWDMDVLRREAEADERNCRLRGISFVSYSESAYPPLLRELYDPPVVLFYRGLLPDPVQPLLAVVGTRKPTGTAAAETYDIARVLGNAGIPVVSGLALGIDAMAHRGNLDGGGGTIGVLGCGLDRIYPAGNRALARKILDRQGALCGEYPPGTLPHRWHFPARNRIIAGLARGTLVVEAPASSGALITAQFALEQGRDLWVTRGALFSPQGEGTLKLAQEGAGVISGGEEILAEWGLDLSKVDSHRIKPDTIDTIKERPEGAKLAYSLARTLNITL